MSSDPIFLQSAKVRANVYRTGALLTDVAFLLGHGQWVQPLATPTWQDTPEQGRLGHMRRLGGEFFCLPFGGSGMVNQPTEGWEDFIALPANPVLHGPCANEDWSVIASEHNEVTLQLHFPQDHAIQFVERRIKLSEAQSRIDIEIQINARRSALVPAAFHPILRLPEIAGELTIEAEFSLGLTYPGIIESDRMVAEPAREFRALAQVPRRHGGTVDLGRLPLGPAIEDVVLMAGMRTPVRANFTREGFCVVLDWNREQLPHCMVWIHDRGIDSEPWAGQYRGVGLEPMAAAFDGPWDLSTKSNPLNAKGYTTAIKLEPNAATRLSCSISVEDI